MAFPLNSDVYGRHYPLPFTLTDGRKLPWRDFTVLHLMTWNVRYFAHHLRGLRATRRGVASAANALGRLDPLPDVICLQELETRSLRAGFSQTSQLYALLDALHSKLQAEGSDRTYQGLYFPAHRYGFRRGPAFYTTGLAMLIRSDWEILEHNAISPTPITHVEPGWSQRLKQTRILAHAKVKRCASTLALDIFNTHLSLPSFFEVGPTKVASRMGDGSNQLREVETLLGALKERADLHAILVGDFNTRPGSPAYQRLLQHGLIDVFEPCDQHPPVPNATAGFGPLRMHIDHVFATPDLEFERMESPNFGEPHLFHGLSDHTPKLARFRWPRG